jgi:hypothetical protein
LSTRFENNHDCNNATCRLLNPSLERLLDYDDLKNRVSKADEIFFYDLKHWQELTSSPLGLFGWASVHHVFQLLNIEFIRELAKEIKKVNPEIILEVGAGEGLLGKFLSKELEKDIILTDDYSWWNKEKIKIENKDIIMLDYIKAIKRYKPDFIIASWIPYKKWWTKEFIKCKSVKAYIVIGEGPGGCTGSDMDWETSWTRHDLDNVSKYAICRTDSFGRTFGRITHTHISLFERS